MSNYFLDLFAKYPKVEGIDFVPFSESFSSSVDADICFIKYGDAASLQKFHNEPKSKIVNWLFMPECSFYIITLLGGSVIENEYEVDLE